MQKKSTLALRIYTKFMVFATLLLIFAGALVKSHGVGLSVPDWPTTYGYNMFTFPLADMIGGIFYEHGHRLLAALVGFLTVVLALWIYFGIYNTKMKKLGFAALGMVVTQGLLGGITVLLMLPTAVSLLHGVLAQTFLILLIIIAYRLSAEWNNGGDNTIVNFPYLRKGFLWLVSLIYVQLILGAWMRHTESGLAIPDFPLMAGYWIPTFSSKMLNSINDWRFDMDFPMVTIGQVFIHFIHRLVALFITLTVGIVSYRVYKTPILPKSISNLMILIIVFLFVQILLGAFTIWSLRAPYLTSFHVVTGAGLLGLAVLMVLRLSPVKMEYQQV